MGNTWEVSVWIFVDWRGDYAYEEYWRGESAILAVWHFVKAKRQGIKCVKIEWR